MANQIRKKFPDVKVIVGDCQKKIDAPDSFFDRILAIHVLEHLPDLPACLKEIDRILKIDSGIFIVVIPCEGTLFYNFSRNLTSRRIFERRYNTKYDWLMEAEHINKPDEIIEELGNLFKINKITYFPFYFPSQQINLCIGLVLSKR
jgi:ubiquinone/menaquinone biosynthesis C-methylase UbiE